MPLRLPPLNTLRFFEAAARHLSLRLAAVELGVTRGGVSRGIQGLEDWLGIALFARTSRGLMLTDAGKKLYPEVQRFLVDISTASASLNAQLPRSQISVSVAPSFARFILLPRLNEFRSRYPHIAISIDTAHKQIEFPRDGVDVAIRVGRGGWERLSAIHLMTEDLIPVLSPRLASQYSDLSALQDAPLIHVMSVTQDWEAWAAASGYGSLSRTGMRVDSIQMAMEAAAQGLGIALGRLPLVHRELASGQLVVGPWRMVRAATSYWLVGLPEMMTAPEITAFRLWLEQEIRELVDSLRNATPGGDQMMAAQ